MRESRRCRRRDDLVGRGVAFALRLQRDEHAALVERRGRTARPDLIADRGDRRVLQHDVGDRFDALGHVDEGDVLPGLGDAENEAGVLLREEALGNDDVEHAGDDDGREHDHERDEAVAQRHLQAAVVDGDETVESVLGHPVEPAAFCAGLGREEPRAQHRRQRQRDAEREDERHRHRDGEFLKQLADIAAHQKQRNEHRDQGQRDRDDGEADLARAFQRGLHRREAVFEVTHDVLDDDDGVVDDEADGDRQSHQRQIVEAVAQRVKRRERADQGQRHRDRRNDGGPEAAQEKEDHHHHQGDAQDQRELHVINRGADGRRAVGHDIDLDGGRDRRLELRQAAR